MKALDHDTAGLGVLHGVTNHIVDDLANLPAVADDDRRRSTWGLHDVEGEAMSLGLSLVDQNSHIDGRWKVERVLQEEVVALLRPREVL